MVIEFVEYSRTFLEKSWEWLNDKEIKELAMTPDFTKEQQEQFFNSLADRTNYFIKGITCNSVPIGACGLKNITKKDAECWGYVGKREYWGQGVGEKFMKYLFEIAKEKKLESLYGRVSQSNERSINMVKKLSFSVEKIDDAVITFRLRI